MKLIRYLAIAIVSSLTTFCYAEVKLGENTTVVFATVEEGKRVLTTRDDFVRRLSPFDRSARMKVDREVSEEEFLNFVGLNVLAWTAAEKQKLETVLEGLQARLQSLALPFPETIYVIKTTGVEEGGAAYTRDSAVVLPTSKLSESMTAVDKLICHELFHILSRQNPDLKEALYEIIGFSKCDEIEFPAELKSRKITNPDAPKNDHCIRLQIDGKERWAVPILFSTTEKYDVQRGGEFFNYMQFQFLLVERDSDSLSVKPIYDGTSPRLVRVQQVSGFFEQIGRNTGYIIHPEEILADNFSLLVLDERNVKSPEILKKMKDVLTEKDASTR